ncbi:creatininase family protein [Rhodococcus globerulus]|uniref:Creatininase family protein n=1 Tax=Rhodococcus globerulus TaxID=33008 RepID=A0ABU4C3H5_RHOGO|nr:creatininase family protein [Rhodococcus globerulus]MDV6271049.1 creatininase family protein [Rhodococcus globerulus]
MTTTISSPRSMADSTWTQVQDAMNEGVRNVIFAVGATEQHGPHLPLSTDILIGTATSLAVAAKVGATMVAPTLPFGVSPHHMSFPGTVSLSESTFLDVVEDYVRSLAAHGFDNILIISSHGGNFEPLTNLIERIGTQIGQTRIHAHTDLLQLLAAFEGVAAEDSISPEECGSHAGDFETSIVLALHPDLVDMSVAEPGFLGHFNKETAAALFEGGTKALSTNGILGNPVAALASRGERYLESLTTLVAEYFCTEIARHEGNES